MSNTHSGDGRLHQREAVVHLELAAHAPPDRAFWADELPFIVDPAPVAERLGHLRALAPLTGPLRRPISIGPRGSQVAPPLVAVDADLWAHRGLAHPGRRAVPARLLPRRSRSSSAPSGPARSLAAAAPRAHRGGQ